MDRREEFFLRFPLIISYVELRFSELEQKSSGKFVHVLYCIAGIWVQFFAMVDLYHFHGFCFCG